MPDVITKKGINFKQTPVKKLLLIHPETLMDYLNSLPRSENGWIAFDFRPLPKLSKTNLFAHITPTGKK